MHHIQKNILCGLLTFSALGNADDTEIYGTSEIDEDNRINSNVLFIMDTSGSMDGEVEVTQNPYNAATNYSGSYNTNEIYNGLNDDSNDGHSESALESSQSYECEATLTALQNEGRALGEYYQYRGRKWQKLKDGSDNDIRCDQGNATWLYSGNYMNWYHDGDNVTTSTRMEVVVNVVKELTHSLNNINLGLMRFDQNSDGGMVDVAIGDISTTGQKIRDKLDSYYPKGGTPLEETLYEASRYYRGETIAYGLFSSPNGSTTDSRTSLLSTTYKSPIDATCQKNHIILLTDGEPTNDSSANDEIQDLVSSMSLPSGLSSSCNGDGECMDELAYFLNNTDQASSHVGSQSVTTYTIGGFDLEEGVELLKRTASFGGGQYYEANDTAGLSTALESIFLDILATDSTFTAPAVSVNAFNSSQHSDLLYYALFKPNDNVKWDGNLKKYRLDNDGIVVDANGDVAVSESSGYFNEGIFDFWNATDYADGDDVTLGGFANLFSPEGRVIYSESGGSLQNFSSVVNRTTLDMAANTDDEVNTVINWAIGYDVDDADGDGSEIDSRYQIGDPLHSAPVVVTYGGSESDPDATIFFGTNEGFIHALDADTGAEQFAFIPSELHENLPIYYNNTQAASDKPYGMDGQITTWMYDLNNNNVILDGSGSIESGEHLYLYAGMRRGGNNYYGLDISNRASPSLLFTIKGGEDDYTKLGQSWGRATVAKVKFAGESRFVLLIPGGYDTNQDANNVAEEDAIGNAIYMVDAATGERLWWASATGANLNISSMVNSIPASLSAIDISGDGHVDYFFAADMGGRVFRVDINPNNTGPGDFAVGGAIASLSGESNTDNRRFYNKPNVSLVKDKQYGDYLTIALGSGHRAHPIYTTDVENRFYVLKDFNPYSVPSSYVALTEAAESKKALSNGELPNPSLVYNATDIMNGEELSIDMQSLLSSGGGFYVTFDTHAEKVLAESTTFAGAIMFTTFSPSGETSSNCGPDTGHAQFYAIDQRTAAPVLDLDNDGDIDENDASTILAHSGIAPHPVIIYGEDGIKTIAIGTETIVDERFEPTTPCDGENCEVEPTMCDENICYVTPVYWRQNDAQE